MEIVIPHGYNKPADIVWDALKCAIGNSPDFQDKHIHWEDKHAEGEYTGCRITMDVIKEDPERMIIQTKIEGPWILLAPLKGKITSKIKKDLSAIELS